MITVELFVNVDGITYGVAEEVPTGYGGNNTQKALDTFNKHVETIRRTMRANLPTDSRPKVEYRSVDSGEINVKPVRGAEGTTNANRGPYS